ncbi:hypothetical protein HX866_11490 [Pseudomonas gingeri]|uniref:hypothetical protein n=1 Tax=Pseudomonas gingeri TaxID=117681 RepID=UPI0015A1B6CB|nr:hypothetical protein [Pseudomonas gingeri]NWA25519.1 hypothetical protein [Pseudomonas gingeri]
MIELVGSVEGHYSVELYRVDSNGVEVPGTRRQPVPPFKNLITNIGLDRMAVSADWLGFCQVGSGTSTPVFTDTALGSRISGVNYISDVPSAQPSAPYFASTTRTFRFAAGVATGNLSEVGVGWAATGSLFSRALIVDTAGSPTTITVLADETLDVTYQFRCYPPLVDTSGTVVIAGVSYSWVGRASQVNSINARQGWIAPEAGVLVYSETFCAYNGPIGSIVQTPAGAIAYGASTTALAYSPGTYSREGTMTFDLVQGNVAGGISAISYRHGIGSYQIGFSPSIPKDGSKVLSLTVRTTWARKTI